jgi:hypothetical protein
VLLMEARRRAAAWGESLAGQERVMGPSRRREEPNQKIVRTVVVPGERQWCDRECDFWGGTDRCSPRLWSGASFALRAEIP